MTTFSYPKSRHSRTQTPPEYANYRSYKPFLRIEFDRCCVYCRHPDGIKTTDAFGVDHYRPKKLFPALATSYLNLYYCCNACNARKDAYWPANSFERTHFIPNPCEHEMFRHLRYDGAKVESKTRAGEVAVATLQLNDSVSIRWRETVLQSIDALQARAVQVGRWRLQNEVRRRKNQIDEATFREASASLSEKTNQIQIALYDLGATDTI